MKTFNWEKFMLGGITVHCKTKQECSSFLRMTREYGFTWSSFYFPREQNHFSENKSNALYRINSYKHLEYDTVRHNIEEGNTILEWSDYMEFTLEDLKVGMLVETNCGKALVMPYKYGHVLAYEKGNRSNLSELDFNDISKVWSICDNMGYVMNFTGYNRNLVYERPVVKEMTVEEISKALGYEVKIVK
ncbi:MAG: hypothetical protein RR365_08635 [Bacteroides sp.]